jgi:hypothetical protein
MPSVLSFLQKKYELWKLRGEWKYTRTDQVGTQWTGTVNFKWKLSKSYMTARSCDSTGSPIVGYDHMLTYENGMKILVLTPTSHPGPRGRIDDLSDVDGVMTFVLNVPQHSWVFERK